MKQRQTLKVCAGQQETWPRPHGGDGGTAALATAAGCRLGFQAPLHAPARPRTSRAPWTLESAIQSQPRLTHGDGVDEG